MVQSSCFNHGSFSNTSGLSFNAATSSTISIIFSSILVLLSWNKDSDDFKYCCHFFTLVGRIELDKNLRAPKDTGCGHFCINLGKTLSNTLLVISTSDTQYSTISWNLFIISYLSRVANVSRASLDILMLQWNLATSFKELVADL